VVIFTDVLGQHIGPIIKGFLKMGQMRCTETSVKDYHSTLHNIPKESGSHQHGGESLK
jgi:hypothetical protein